MKRFFALIAFIFTAQAFAQLNDPRVLWTYTLRSNATRDYYKHGCATTKQEPFNVEMCFSEKFRNNLDQPIQAYVKFFSNGSVETFQVVKSSKWEFLYRTTQYVSNSSFYARTITLEDSSGRRSDVREVFTTLSDYYDGIIRSRSISGILPNGERLPLLENYYVFPSYIKNY